MTASTLPAANASIEGAYSNQSNLTSTPASLNHPFWIPTSNAVQPGQSEKPMRNGALAGAAFATGGARFCVGLKLTVARTAAIKSVFFIGAG